MRVKVFESDTTTPISEACDLLDCFPDDPDEYEAALAELNKSGRYWAGGGAAALLYIVKERT
jgi:hypothetical protein